MKIRISMPDAYMAVEFEEERAVEVFRKLNESLLCLKGKAKKKSVSGKKASIVIQEENEGLLATSTEDSHTKTKLSEDKDEPVMGYFKYRGFLHIKCAECGAVRGFCAKTEISESSCRECGGVTKYTEPLLSVQMRCECGSAYWYKTNIKDNIFDINCLTCGSPVAVQWNEKRQLFETVR